jgi:RNA polymerase sigma-70 factor (ECF subfamily)
MKLDFELFFDEEYERMVRALTFAAGSRAAAEDWAQDAFATAFRKWSTVAATDRPRAWVYVVALRAGRRRRRREGRLEPERELSVTDGTDVVASAVDLRAALATLSVRQRTVVVLTYFAGLSTAEIADGLGVASGTVKATLHQARQLLRVELVGEK